MKYRVLSNGRPARCPECSGICLAIGLLRLHVDYWSAVFIGASVILFIAAIDASIEKNKGV